MTKSNTRPAPPALIEFLDELQPEHFLPLESEDVFRGMLAVTVDDNLLPELLSETLSEGLSIPIREVLLQGCRQGNLARMSADPNYTPVGIIKVECDVDSLTVVPLDLHYLTVEPIPLRRYSAYVSIIRLLNHVAGTILSRTEQFLANQRLLAGVSTMALPEWYAN